MREPATERRCRTGAQRSSPFRSRNVRTVLCPTKTLTCSSWSLRRSAKYGSQHYDEKTLAIASATLDAQGRAVTLSIPDLAPTHSYELKARLRGTDGAAIERSLHGTLHHLASP